MKKKTKVVIIGAGAAGIAAASRLLRKGVDDFIVLEATNRIGGRINTVDFADNVVDLGAQWVHGESGNVVFELASKYNLLGSFSALFEPENHLFITTNGEIVPKEESIEALKIYYYIMEQAPEQLQKEKGSFGDYFIKEYYKLYEEKPFATRTRAAHLLSWINKMQSSVECCDTWFDVSAARLAEYHHCEGDELLNWKDRGYKTLFDLLLKIPNEEECLPVMKKVEFKRVVRNINYSGDDIVVSTNDGSQYLASHVIFTASLGVLKDKLLTMFTPPLSQNKQRAIKGLNIGTVNKIFLEFPRRWWPEGIASFDFIVSKEEQNKFSEHGYGWLCDVFMIHIIDRQPNVLCAWIVGERARFIENYSDDEVLHGLNMLLEESLGKHYSVVRPKKILMSRWNSNEHFQGSYSFQSTFTDLVDVRPKDLAEPIVKDGDKPVILFAGEATHDHYYSTVHGAVETGFREADRIIDYRRRRLNSRL